MKTKEKLVFSPGCDDCHYFMEAFPYVGEDVCSHEKSQFSHDNLYIDNRTCDEMRNDETLCGKKAKLFKPYKEEGRGVIAWLKKLF